MLNQTELSELVVLRHALHKAPEISGEEAETAKTIAAYLMALSPDGLVTQLGGHGVAAIFEGAAPGPTILIRCELDGLPIREISELRHRSRIDGKGHLCGHDGHMAIVCGLAKPLQAQRPRSGRVVLLFQPAEETGAGAYAVTTDPKFAAMKPDYAFALHNFPGAKLGMALIKQGPINCASRGLRVVFEGKTSHASNPADGISPMGAISTLMPELTEFSKGDVNDADFALVTIVHAALGEAAFGISPGRAEVWATLRTIADDQMDRLVAACEQSAARLAGVHGLKHIVSYDDVFAASDNNPVATAMVLEALELESVSHKILSAPARWSEDFGVFGQHCKSAMFFLGSGENQPQLHNPDFDFPDELIETGVKIFHQIIRRKLK
ncbi:MAG: amidohydrolase [Hyphomicrobiales bacterium]